MKIGILGTGDVGRALGTAFIALGHEVRMGAREEGNGKALAWAKAEGSKASTGTFAAAADFGELIVMATLGTANASVIQAAGTEPFRGKVVIDTTNPLDFSAGMPPMLAVAADDSAGEQIQRALPSSFVVKAFNTVGHAHMFKPDFPGGPPDMFICGEDESAKRTVAGLLKEFGWGVVDVGGIIFSRHLEAMCIVWVGYAVRSGGWNHAFKLLRK